jgi:iron complex transport system substrate-binding protein
MGWSRQIKVSVFFIGFGFLFLTGCASSIEMEAIDPVVENGFPVKIENYDALQRSSVYTYLSAPKRVLITYPGATELLLELEMDAHIIGTVEPYGAAPRAMANAYAKLPLLEAVYIPSQEEIYDMQPDLIIGWAHNFTDNEMGDVQNWHEHKIGTYIVPGTLPNQQPTVENSVYPFMDDMGRIFGIQEKAMLLIAQSKARIQVVKDKLGQMASPKKILILQSHGNGTYSLYGENYLINDLVQKAEAENLVQEQISFVGPERILAYDPDYIIYVSSSMETGKDLTDAEAIHELQNKIELRSLRAIQNRNIINIPFNDANNCNSRAVYVVEKIAHELYPNKFSGN